MDKLDEQLEAAMDKLGHAIRNKASSAHVSICCEELGKKIAAVLANEYTEHETMEFAVAIKFHASNEIRLLLAAREPMIQTIAYNCTNKLSREAQIEVIHKLNTDEMKRQFGTADPIEILEALGAKADEKTNGHVKISTHESSSDDDDGPNFL